MPAKRKSETSAGVRVHALGEEVFTTEQVAHDLNLSVKTIYRAIETGKLKGKKTGKQFLITRSAVREYFESLPSAQEPGPPRKPREPKATPSAQELESSSKPKQRRTTKKGK